MSHNQQFYIDGKWVDPVEPQRIEVIDPSTALPFERISAGSPGDVDLAVAAARRAFTSYARTTTAQRVELLDAIIAGYKRRSDELAAALSREMGAPLRFARTAQVGIGLAHLERIVDVLKRFPFHEQRGGNRVVHEPVGVCGLITPWNWPLNQITCKIAPALAAGCTMVLKPSEIAPLDAIIIAEILDDAGVPAGVFNLVNGDGPTVGEALARHPDVDMMSFTGSTRAGILVAKAAADTVKRVHQELGGKSPNILLPDADFEQAVRKGVAPVMENAGQSCNAPTRMLVPRERIEQVAQLAAAAAQRYRVGPADDPASDIGPVVSEVQFDKIQALIQSGIDDGAQLVLGGTGRPKGLTRGYFVRPTVFSNVTPQMRIAREEIFGPVLSIIAYDSLDEAIRIANDTPYGLAAYVQSADLKKAREVAAALRAGTVHINYPAWDSSMPFGGYKQSGNGREYAEFGLADFLEIKGVLGYGEAA